MTAQQVLVRVLETRLSSFIETAAKVPADKLDWVPQPGVRSALDQYREVACIVGHNWQPYAEYKLEFSPEVYASQKEAREQFSTHEELEAQLRRDTQKLIDYTLATPAELLSHPIQMPFPGEYILADLIHYHAYNMAYHEGQIMTLLLLMGVESLDY